MDTTEEVIVYFTLCTHARTRTHTQTRTQTHTCICTLIVRMMILNVIKEHYTGKRVRLTKVYLSLLLFSCIALYCFVSLPPMQIETVIC